MVRRSCGIPARQDSWRTTSSTNTVLRSGFRIWTTKSSIGSLATGIVSLLVRPASWATRRAVCNDSCIWNNIRPLTIGFIDDYVEAGHGHAYLLFYQLEKIRNYFSTLENALDRETMKKQLELPQMAEDFKSKKPDEQPEVFGIVSASFGLIGAMVPQVAGPAGVVGSLSGLVGAATKEENEPDVDYGELHAMLSLKLEDAFTKISNRMQEIVFAIFGEEGYDQALIPAEMTKQSWDNSVVNVLGDGQWLIAHASDGVDELVDSMYTTLVSQLSSPPIHLKEYFSLTVLTEGRPGLGGNPVRSKGFLVHRHWRREGEVRRRQK